MRRMVDHPQYAWLRALLPYAWTYLGPRGQLTQQRAAAKQGVEQLAEELREVASLGGAAWLGGGQAGGAGGAQQGGGGGQEEEEDPIEDAMDDD